MGTLETLLRDAARSSDWNDAVVHRCAWCQRRLTSSGDYDLNPRPLTNRTVFTDGMCNTCGAQALAHLSQRRRLPKAA